jgi:hypothetical protein
VNLQEAVDRAYVLLNQADVFFDDVDVITRNSLLDKVQSWISTDHDRSWPFEDGERLGIGTELSEGKAEACLLFAAIFENSRKEPIRRCSRCNLFFAARSARQLKYCSLRCSRKESAKLTLKRQRREEKERRLERLSVWLQRLISMRRPPRDWKQWICKRARVSRKFLSQSQKDIEVRRLLNEWSACVTRTDGVKANVDS